MFKLVDLEDLVGYYKSKSLLVWSTEMNLRLGGGACPFLLIFFSIIGSAGIERVLREGSEGYIMRVPKEHCNQKRQFTAYCFVGIVLSKRQRMLKKEILNNRARATTQTIICLIFCISPSSFFPLITICHVFIRIFF